MKQVNVKLYSFEELSENAKNRVISDNRDDIYSWHANDIWCTAMETLKKFEYFFDCRASGVEIDIYRHYCSVSVQGDYNDTTELADITGRHLQRMVDYIVENYIIKKKVYYHPNYLKNGKKRTSKFQREFTGYELTGMCYDYDILKPVIDFYSGKMRPGKSFSYQDLMELCIDSLLASIQKELEWVYSDEYIADYITDSFDDDFLETGERAKIA